MCIFDTNQLFPLQNVAPAEIAGWLLAIVSSKGSSCLMLLCKVDGNCAQPVSAQSVSRTICVFAGGILLHPATHCEVAGDHFQPASLFARSILFRPSNCPEVAVVHPQPVFAFIGMHCFVLLFILKYLVGVSQTLFLSAGSVLLRPAIHREMAGGSFSGQCAGQPVQRAQEARRSFPQQHSGSGLWFVA